MTVTQMRPPVRSDEQCRIALDKANRVRIKRADIKRQLDAGDLDWRDVIVSTDPDLATMKVYEVMTAVRGVGRVKAQAMLDRCKVSSSKTLAGLTDRQRTALTGDSPLASERPQDDEPRITVREQLRRAERERDAALAQLNRFHAAIARKRVAA